MAMKGDMILMFLVAILFYVASAAPGIATFYTSYTPSACFGDHPQGVMIAAAGDPLFQNGAVCGKTYRVRCTSGTNPVPHPCNGNNVTVRIVDHCPGCKATLDLSQEAFSTIANPVAGIINIDYVQV